MLGRQHDPGRERQFDGPAYAWLTGTEPGELAVPRDWCYEASLIKVFVYTPKKGADLFDRIPSPLPNELSFSKVEGMLLGLAVGDALGITSEGYLPADRGELFGEIRDYLPNRYNSREEGYPSDDTQLAFWTLEQTSASDNGRVFELVEEARQPWWGIP